LARQGFGKSSNPETICPQQTLSNRVYLRDIPVDLFPGQAELLKIITNWFVRSEHCHQVVTINARMLMTALTNPALRQVMRRVDLVVVDGYGVEQALRRRGYTAFTRMAGIDLVKELLSWGSSRALPVYCYGGSVMTRERLTESMKRYWPGIEIGGIYDGYEARSTPEEIKRELLQSSRPRLVLVGLGTPAQELFLAQLLPQLSGGVVGIGVGGALEVLAGNRMEAPRWVRDNGWEWGFRMAQQPRKLRGIVDLVRFWRCFLR
jgi:N-acetylglucosaminyldiphosphoundecaprenol N-acetyl-beta-D-mannosaminyltransferase